MIFDERKSFFSEISVYKNVIYNIAINTIKIFLKKFLNDLIKFSPSLTNIIRFLIIHL